MAWDRSGRMMDADLLARWGDGDREAAGALLDRHFATVYRFFATKVGDVADDLAQQTFLACVERRETLHNRSTFRAFVLGCARIELLRHLRAKAQRKEIDLGEVSLRDLGTSPSTAARRNEEQHRLLEALRALPVDVQTIVELYYWEGMSTAEIADVVEVAPGTVHSRLSRARERLRATLRSPNDALAGLLRRPKKTGSKG